MMKKLTSLLVVLVLVAGVFGAVTASAATTIAELQAMIASLTAQLSALSGGTATVGATAFTQNLTVGSRGAEVSALQEALNVEVGAGLPVTGYFGALTKAAVVKFQVDNGVPGTGYVGPLTRAVLNASQAPVTDTGTTTSSVPGCAAGALFSATSGASCTSGTVTDNTLTGGAGTISDYTLVASISNEDVGEDATDVSVLAVDAKADDTSDIQLTAVKLVFNEGTADSDFDKYASEVSVWVDGKEYARVDASAFTEDNSWTKTVTLSSGAIIKAGKTARILVKVSGVNSLDSGNAGETWTVDLNSVRFVDATGASTSEDPITAVRTMTFTSFATAADMELKISADDSAINTAHTISVDATNDTDNVSLLSFKMKAEGTSDIRVTNLPVTVTVTGVTNVSQIINTLYLYKDGEEVASENVTASGTTDTITFADVDFTIKAGETAKFLVKGKVENFSGSFAAGDTILASFGEANTDMTDFVAKDESGTKLADADKTGSATSEADVAYANTFNITYISSSAVAGDADATHVGSKGSYSIVFDVTAGDSDVYIASSTGTTTGAVHGVLYSVKGGTYIGSDSDQGYLGSTASLATGSGAYKVPTGQTKRFTLTTSLDNTVGADGSYGINVDHILFIDGDTTGFAETAAYLGTMANYTILTAGIDNLETAVIPLND